MLQASFLSLSPNPTFSRYLLLLLPFCTAMGCNGSKDDVATGNTDNVRTISRKFFRRKSSVAASTSQRSSHKSACNEGITNAKDKVPSTEKAVEGKKEEAIKKDDGVRVAAPVTEEAVVEQPKPSKLKDKKVKDEEELPTSNTSDKVLSMVDEAKKMEEEEKVEFDKAKEVEAEEKVEFDKAKEVKEEEKVEDVVANVDKAKQVEEEMVVANVDEAKKVKEEEKVEKAATQVDEATKVKVEEVVEKVTTTKVDEANVEEKVEKAAVTKVDESNKIEEEEMVEVVANLEVQEGKAENAVANIDKANEVEEELAKVDEAKEVEQEEKMVTKVDEAKEVKVEKVEEFKVQEEENESLSTVPEELPPTLIHENGESVVKHSTDLNVVVSTEKKGEEVVMLEKNVEEQQPAAPSELSSN